MFSPGLKPQQEHPFLFHDGIGPKSSDNRYDRWDRMNYASKPAQKNHVGGDGDEYASGVCSPPLWRNSSPPRSPNQQRAHYRSLSPASRAQAIARGQRELMEMVRNMPESCYELSLKDLVERPVVDQARHREERDVNAVMSTRSELGKNNSNKGKETRRNSGATRENEGLLLKMVFPVSFGSKKKKKKKNMMMTNNDQSILANTSSKVSPKPLVSDGSKSGNSNSSTNGNSVDKEWWKKRFSVSGESESGDQSSLNSGSMKSSSGSRSSSGSSRSSSIRYVTLIIHITQLIVFATALCIPYIQD